VSIWSPTYLQQMAQWISNQSISMYGRWNTPSSANEGGVDLPSPGGTPVYALATGVIQGVGNFWHGGGSCLYQGGAGCTPGYGVVTTRVNVPGYGLQDLYYQHINLANGLAVGQTVQKGQLLGTINSAVGEVEMGFNANWGGVWGSNHPAGWVTDPRPMLAALMGQGAPSSVGGSVSSSQSGGPTSTDIVSSIMSAIGLPNSASVTDFIQRFGIVFFGGIVVLLGLLVVFFSKDKAVSS